MKDRTLNDTGKVHSFIFHLKNIHALFLKWKGQVYNLFKVVHSNKHTLSPFPFAKLNQRMLFNSEMLGPVPGNDGSPLF